MNGNEHPLAQEEFRYIFSKVPRLTVEVVIRSSDGVLLTLRRIEPCEGLWHLPGGTVHFGEKLTEAVQRIAKREVGLAVGAMKLLGYIEYPSHYEKGMDSPVGIAFEVISYAGHIQLNAEAEKSGWFNDLPAEMHPEQSAFLQTILKNPPT